MSRGARNIHGLAATLRRLEQEAASGPCRLHPDRPSIGYIVGWNNHPNGVCAACADYGERAGYTIHRLQRGAEQPMNPKGDD